MKPFTQYTTGAMLLLRRLAAKPDANGSAALTMTQCAKVLRGSTAAATGVADRFEKEGLAERIFSARDRRKAWLVITQEGRALVEDFAAAFNAP